MDWTKGAWGDRYYNRFGFENSREKLFECESSSTAEVYYRKVKYAVDLRSKLFICTDGEATKEALDKIKVPEGEGDKLNDFEKQYST